MGTWEVSQKGKKGIIGERESKLGGGKKGNK